MPCVYKEVTPSAYNVNKAMVRARFAWLHTWTKWEAIQSGHHYRRTDENGNLIPAGEPWGIIGYWERQRRECERCGKRQMRKVQA